MTDQDDTVIDLTNIMCSPRETAAGIALPANIVIELVDDSWLIERDRDRPQRTRGRAGSSFTLATNQPIVIADSPLPNPNRSHRRKVGRPSKQTRESLQNEEPEAVRERSPLRGSCGHCPVCLEPYGTQNLVSTKCGHVYCHRCLMQCLRLEKKCPTCRKVLKGNTAFHPIYLNYSK